MSTLKAIWQILTTRCERSSHLASESFDRELSRAERWAMKVHEFVCKSCHRCHRQLIQLRDATQRRNQAAVETEPASLSAAQRARIVDSLRRAGGDDAR